MCIIAYRNNSVDFMMYSHYGTVKRLMTQLEIALGQNYTEAEATINPSLPRNN
jgi:hypothetical protein